MKDIQGIYSTDKDAQGAAYQALMAETKTPVAWAYDVWDELVKALEHRDNRVRAIAGQLLCNLAKSDPEMRMKADLPALLDVTKDERFVTARHIMQGMWKIATVGAPQLTIVHKGLAKRFKECEAEKNCTLIRYDIIVNLRQIFELTKDLGTQTLAEKLIASEDDLKYRKKYAAEWKKAGS